MTNKVLIGSTSCKLISKFYLIKYFFIVNIFNANLNQSCNVVISTISGIVPSSLLSLFYKCVTSM